MSREMKASPRQRIAVAMSGGVDSSVAAALLLEQGYEVIGLMLRLWSEAGKEGSNRCCTPDAMGQARRVAWQLGIPFYAVDAQQAFYDHVVQYFHDGYASGTTPNPCLACNRTIRWQFLLEQALALGAQGMATGHYARLIQNGSGAVQLLRAVDRSKDQSYILHVLDQRALGLTQFPLGAYTKEEVRQLARRFNLPVAERAESQDLCFLGTGNQRNFLLRNWPQLNQPGPIYSRRGDLLGAHQGLAFYTIGQRKGLGIFAPQPLYVLAKDRERNALIVGPVDELGGSELVAGGVNWVSGWPPQARFRAQVKIRYRAKEAWASVAPLGAAQVQVHFDEPVRDITPGQAAVFFDGEVCLGGGIIQAT